MCLFFKDIASVAGNLDHLVSADKVVSEAEQVNTFSIMCIYESCTLRSGTCIIKVGSRKDLLS